MGGKNVSPSGRAQRGATIVLTLSQGPKMIAMPQIPPSDTVAQAEAALRAAGLTAAPVTKSVGVSSPPVNLGAVAGTDPAAGTPWPATKPVTLEVVAGFSLPDLKNTNVAEASALAGQDGFTLQQTPTTSTTVPQGNVISQSPAPGTVLTQGQTVTVQVSSGPPTVSVPDVSGQSCQDAYNALTASGLNFQVNVQQQGFRKNQANSTNPPAGQQVQQGSSVTLQCGSYNPF